MRVVLECFQSFRSRVKIKLLRKLVDHPFYCLFPTNAGPLPLREESLPELRH